MVKKVREASAQGHMIVIFTNQGGASKVAKRKELQGKVEDIVAKLDVPVYSFMATAHNHYRKPAKGYLLHL